MCEEESARYVSEKHGNHLRFRNEARIAYQRDKERAWMLGEQVVSADMMRIFLLPRLPHKESTFTSRLVCLQRDVFPCREVIMEIGRCATTSLRAVA